MFKTGCLAFPSDGHGQDTVLCCCEKLRGVPTLTKRNYETGMRSEIGTGKGEIRRPKLTFKFGPCPAASIKSMPSITLAAIQPRPGRRKFLGTYRNHVRWFPGIRFL